jgi:hypothetical protein
MLAMRKQSHWHLGPRAQSAAAHNLIGRIEQAAILRDRTPEAEGMSLPGLHSQRNIIFYALLF